jgi:hypothetical protein
MKLAALLLIALVACGKDKPAAVVRASCQASPAVCEDYESTDAKYIGRQRDACKGVGTWSDAPCATANVAGSCRETHGWTRTRRFYRGIEGQANPAVEQAKVECGAYGTWVEPSP